MAADNDDLLRLIPPSFAEDYPGWYPTDAVYVIEAINEEGEPRLLLRRWDGSPIWKSIGMLQVYLNDLLHDCTQKDTDG